MTVLKKWFAVRFPFLLGGGLSVLVAASGSAGASVPTTTTVNFTGRVEIASGRKLYLQCRGTGRPTVILEAGLRVRSDYWSDNNAKPPATSVFPGIAKYTHVCAYDRPGTVIGLDVKDRSRSDPVSMPRSAMAAVEDLHELVRAARIPRPFVLAGHSTGGLLIRLYAHSFPDDVAGLVLVDALPDGLHDDLTRAQYRTFLQLNSEAPKALESYKAYETIPFGPAFAQLRRFQATKPLRRMPLVVLSRGRPVALPPGVPPGFSKALERAWRKQQALLARLEPGARHIVATRSDHYIMLEQPGLVVSGIREVVNAVRHGWKRSACAARAAEWERLHGTT